MGIFSTTLEIVLAHRITKAMKACEDLLNQSMHINNIINIQSSEQVCKNRLRLKTSIDTIRWLAFQAYVFRGHEETTESSNRGNFS